MSYPRLSQSQMDGALQLGLYTYGLAGYESVVQYVAEYPIGAAEAIFSWQAAAGAVYTVQSTSYYEPGLLRVYDQAGNPVVDDDATGLPGSDHLTFIAPYSGIFYISPSWVQGTVQGQHGVTLSVYEDLNTVGLPVSAGSEAGDSLNGTPGGEILMGRGGADTLHGQGGDDYFEGGTGLDVSVYGQLRDTYEILSFGDRYLVLDPSGADGRDLMSNVERLAFPDISVAFDVDGAAGKAFRIYQAAFNRAPDASGLGFWIYQLDHGASLEGIAAGFIDSAEFRSIYGTSPSNYEVVYRFYQNVLHREPDAGGLDFWVQVLDANLATRAQVLIGFSESAENYLQLIGTMGNGIAFAPWG
jgi:hypothetical protein